MRHAAEQMELDLGKVFTRQPTILFQLNRQYFIIRFHLASASYRTGIRLAAVIG
jgi:hypothetical protein